MFRSATVIGQTAPGYSSGQAVQAMEEVVSGEGVPEERIRPERFSGY